jgi:hypothetical protein
MACSGVWWLVSDCGWWLAGGDSVETAGEAGGVLECARCKGQSDGERGRSDLK